MTNTHEHHNSEQSPPLVVNPKHSATATVPTPITTAVNADAIPEALKQIDHWLLWRPEWQPDKRKWGKIPRTVHGKPASSTDPATWNDFETNLAANLEAADEGIENGAGLGLGFAVTPELLITGIDLDNCRDRESGIIEPWAQEVIDDMGTYTEISPSGTGFRLWAFGSIPGEFLTGKQQGRKKGNVEVYQGGRYLTVTGDCLAGTPGRVNARQDQLAAFCGRYFQKAAGPNGQGATGGGDTAGYLECEITTEQWQHLAGNPRFESTWERQRTDMADDSASSYDLALANMAAALIWPDIAIRKLLYLWREKHSDRPEKIALDDYWQRTIAKARTTSGEYENQSQPGEARGTASSDSGKYQLTDNGLYYRDDDNKLWIGGPLHIEARTRDEKNDSWGYLLTWPDGEGVRHQWAMPATMLSGGGEEYRSELLDGGYRIAPGTKARNLLTAYIQLNQPKAVALCTDRTGWHGDVFVLPNDTIGQTAEMAVYQSNAANPSQLGQVGTAEQWQEFSQLFRGNSRAVFAVSSMFASPLIELLQEESGGVHFSGGSSIGKTTLLKAARSVWGGEQFMQTWRATTNGLESVAASHSGIGLVLDEIGQVDGREIGECAYMLANGEGKQRAGRSGAARKRYRWKLIFLSSGETDLAQHMRSAGKKSKAGQEIRFLNIAADAGQGHGAFEQLHGFDSGAELAKAISSQAQSCYGTAGPEFVRALAQARQTDPAMTEIKRWRQIALDRITAQMPDNAGGQTARAAERFALIAVAGELATRYGVTGWKPGEAMQAAVTCFKSWMQQRGGGGGSQEEIEILAHVQLFFEQHGNARFERISSEERQAVPNRAGFVEHEQGKATYFMLPESFRRELCGDHTRDRVVQVLAANGILITDDGSQKNTKTKRLPVSSNPRRCYWLRPFLEDSTE